MGHATRAKIILGERFRSWPFSKPEAVTAAQVHLMAEALAERDREQPRVSNEMIESIVRQNDPDATFSWDTDDV